MTLAWDALRAQQRAAAATFAVTFSSVQSTATLYASGSYSRLVGYMTVLLRLPTAQRLAPRHHTASCYYAFISRGLLAWPVPCPACNILRRPWQHAAGSRHIKVCVGNTALARCYAACALRCLRLAHLTLCPTATASCLASFAAYCLSTHATHHTLRCAAAGAVCAGPTGSLYWFCNNGRYPRLPVSSATFHYLAAAGRITCEPIATLPLLFAMLLLPHDLTRTYCGPARGGSAFAGDTPLFCCCIYAAHTRYPAYR